MTNPDARAIAAAVDLADLMIAFADELNPDALDRIRDILTPAAEAIEQALAEPHPTPPRCLPLPDVPAPLLGDLVVAHASGDENHPVGLQLTARIIGVYPDEVFAMDDRCNAHALPYAAIIRNLTHEAWCANGAA